MKLRTSLKLSLLVMSLGMTLANAEETPGSAAATPGGHAMGGMGMNNVMMMSDEKLKEKQEHLLKMHELSSKILAATDPKEKDRLKAEQLQLMKDHEKQHHMMMQQHMQQMMQNRGGMPGMQHGTPPVAPPAPPHQ